MNSSIPLKESINGDTAVSQILVQVNKRRAGLPLGPAGSGSGGQGWLPGFAATGRPPRPGAQQGLCRRQLWPREWRGLRHQTEKGPHPNFCL